MPEMQHAIPSQAVHYRDGYGRQWSASLEYSTCKDEVFGVWDYAKPCPQNCLSCTFPEKARAIYQFHADAVVRARYGK